MDYRQPKVERHLQTRMDLVAIPLSLLASKAPQFGIGTDLTDSETNNYQRARIRRLSAVYHLPVTIIFSLLRRTLYRKRFGPYATLYDRPLCGYSYRIPERCTLRIGIGARPPGGDFPAIHLLPFYSDSYAQNPKV